MFCSSNNILDERILVQKFVLLHSKFRLISAILENKVLKKTFWNFTLGVTFHKEKLKEGKVNNRTKEKYFDCCKKVEKNKKTKSRKM